MSIKHNLFTALYRFKFRKNVQNKSKMYRWLSELGYKISFSQDQKFVFVSNNTFDFKFPTESDIPMAGAYIQKDYNFTITKPYVMFDIGMNMATTSILFAQSENIKQIYGFEPFHATYKIALDNIKRNKNSEKIHPFNYGLSNRNETLEFSYNIKRSICMSTLKGSASVKCPDMDKVEIRKASEVLAPLFKEQEYPIFMKIDCEGSEWDILPDLAENNLFEKVEVLIMEYHMHSTEKLIEILTKAGMFVFDFRDYPCKTGILRAVKK